MAVHVIANQKGGVGKTTVTVQLAALVADTIGRRAGEVPVLGVSTDPQASMLEWAQRAGEALPFDFVQCDDPAALAGLRGHLGRYAHIFVDTPGSLDQQDVLRQVLGQADQVIVPVEPEPLAFAPAARTIREVIAPSGVPFRVLVNNWDPRDGVVDMEETQAYLAAKGFPTFTTVVRHYKVHARAAVAGLTAERYPPNRVSLQAREDFLRLVCEVLGANGQPPRHALNAVSGARAVDTPTARVRCVVAAGGDTVNGVKGVR
ncbi:MAG: AAA family ATPase [Pseudonocardia sp.]